MLFSAYHDDLITVGTSIGHRNLGSIVRWLSTGLSSIKSAFSALCWRSILWGDIWDFANSPVVSICLINYPQIYCHYKDHYIVLLDSADQEFRQGVVGQPCLCSSMIWGLSRNDLNCQKCLQWLVAGGSTSKMAPGVGWLTDRLRGDSCHQHVVSCCGLGFSTTRLWFWEFTRTPERVLQEMRAEVAGFSWSGLRIHSVIPAMFFRLPVNLYAPPRFKEREAIHLLIGVWQKSMWGRRFCWHQFWFWKIHSVFFNILFLIKSSPTSLRAAMKSPDWINLPLWWFLYFHHPSTCIGWLCTVRKSSPSSLINRTHGFLGYWAGCSRLHRFYLDALVAPDLVSGSSFMSLWHVTIILLFLFIYF